MRNLLRISTSLILFCGIGSTILWWNLDAERELAASLRTQISNAMPETLTTPLVAQTTQASDVSALLRDASNLEREQLNDPEFRNSRLAQIRASLDRNNPGVAESLELSTTELDELFDLLANHELTVRSESLVLVADQNDPAAIQELGRKRQETLRHRDEAIAALLGPARIAKWQAYQQDAPARSRAASINSLLFRAGLPMDERQLKSLTAALVAETRRQREALMVLSRDIDTPGPMGQSQLQVAFRKTQEEFEHRLLEAATSTLSAEQLEVLGDQIRSQDALPAALALSLAGARERNDETQPQTRGVR